MFDQSFTSENFRKIFDYENRKGNYLEGKFFPEIAKIMEELKQNIAEIRGLKRNQQSLDNEIYETKRIELSQRREVLRNKKEELLLKELEKLSLKISKGEVALGLKQVQIKGKTAYTFSGGKNSGSAATYFALKQIQYNIRKLYKVKQSNRFNILSQLREVIDNPFPKYLIRTDIKDFFETIPGDALLTKIDSEPLLALPSKKIIRRILHDYKALSGNSNGIPRGVGISAYLSELYMRNLDEEILSQPDVIFYARYVDDIVIVYAPKPNSNNSKLLENLIHIVGKHGLATNSTKTVQYELPIKDPTSLTYLGYTFKLASQPIKLALSEQKVLRYKRKIELSFQAYHSAAKNKERRARKILLKRIKFLTTNTRLLNNKEHAVVGIYFSNCLMTCDHALLELDIMLKAEINKLSLTDVRDSLDKMSFEQGFKQKRFSQFSTNDLITIVKVWKYAT